MSTPPVLMPMAARVLVEFFEAEFAELVGFGPIDVCPRTPSDRPERWLLVRQIGARRRDVVTEVSTLTIEGWSGTELAPQPSDAELIVRTARALLWAARGQVIGTTDPTTLSSVVDVAGPADLPDPASNQPRWTCTVDVALRGHPLVVGS